MNQQEITQVFDQQAAHYDENWQHVSPIKDAMHLMLQASFSDLPDDARILCVGAGTGQEVLYLADVFPEFSFTIVEPAPAMIKICEELMTEQGNADRCYFHEGYLDTLPQLPEHHAATCILVSHFLIDPEVRTDFFSQIANRLVAGGRLFNVDLTANQKATDYPERLQHWLSVLAKTGMDEEQKQHIIESYQQDVALLPTTIVSSMIKQAGFENPTSCFQAGLIQAMTARAPN